MHTGGGLAARAPRYDLRPGVKITILYYKTTMNRNKDFSLVAEDANTELAPIQQEQKLPFLAVSGDL